jgi:hypothetical protein
LAQVVAMVEHTPEEELAKHEGQLRALIVASDGRSGRYRICCCKCYEGARK